MSAQPTQNPTPEEIRQACLLIQAAWTEAERLKRLRPDWRPVVQAADGRTVAANLEDHSECEVSAGPSVGVSRVTT